MSDEVSPRLALPYLAAGQAQKEMLVNEALQRIDALVQPVVLSADLTVAPGAREPGQCWIVGAGATGEWENRSGSIAQWTGGGWRFAAPQNGWKCHVLDRQADMSCQDGQWRNDGVRADGVYIDGKKVIGPQANPVSIPSGGAVIDNEVRLAVSDIIMRLRQHGLIST